MVDVIERLKWLGHNVTVHDPLADPEEAVHEYHLTLDADALSRRYNAVVLAVPHAEYLAMDPAVIGGLVKDGGLVADIKGALRGKALPAAIARWQL